MNGLCRCTTVPRCANGVEISMPAMNWFLATTLVMLLCGIAIVLPFVLGMAAT
jgi:hypothetical protein